MVYLVDSLKRIVIVLCTWYCSRARVALKIINFLRDKEKFLNEKNYCYVNDFICLVTATIYSWVEKSDSFTDGVTGSKKDWATGKSRVTNGVNSSTRNSLIGVSAISFWGGRCTERGRRAGSRNHQLTIVLRAFLRERHCGARGPEKSRAANASHFVNISIFNRRSPRRFGNDITEWKSHELNNARSIRVESALYREYRKTWTRYFSVFRRLVHGNAV